MPTDAPDPGEGCGILILSTLALIIVVGVTLIALAAAHGR